MLALPSVLACSPACTVARTAVAQIASSSRPTWPIRGWRWRGKIGRSRKKGWVRGAIRSVRRRASVVSMRELRGKRGRSGGTGDWRQICLMMIIWMMVEMGVMMVMRKGESRVRLERDRLDRSSLACSASSSAVFLRLLPFQCSERPVMHVATTLPAVGNERGWTGMSNNLRKHQPFLTTGVLPTPPLRFSSSHLRCSTNISSSSSSSSSPPASP